MKRALQLVVAFGSLVGAMPAHAAIFTPNTLLDGVDIAPGDGVCDADPGAPVVCTLRAAVQEANALGGDDVIQLGAGTYLLSIAGIEEDAAAGDLDVSSTVRIEGAGSGQTVIDQTTVDRVFETGLLTGDLTLADLTVSGGDVAGNTNAFGGGIRNIGVLDLERVNVIGNRAFIGGGIANFKTMTASEVMIYGNTATSRGAALSSQSFSASGPPPTTLLLSDSTIGPNTSAIPPTEMELANADGVLLANVTVSPATPGVQAVTIGNQNASLVHVTLLGGLGLFSFAEDDEVSFTNSAIEYCVPSVDQTPILIRNGVNASADASCGFAADGGIEAPFGLGPLADNGGPTPTHLPGEASPLVNAAAPQFCAAFDQRGLSRPRGPGCDIGAIEVPEPSSALAATIAVGALAALARRRERA